MVAVGKFHALNVVTVELFRPSVDLVMFPTASYPYDCEPEGDTISVTRPNASTNHPALRCLVETLMLEKVNGSHGKFGFAPRPECSCPSDNTSLRNIDRYY
jgi:hypothetical protein